MYIPAALPVPRLDDEQPPDFREYMPSWRPLGSPPLCSLLFLPAFSSPHPRLEGLLTGNSHPASRAFSYGTYPCKNQTKEALFAGCLFLLVPRAFSHEKKPGNEVSTRAWLVRALWLVNLAGRTLLHGPLKFKVDSVAVKLFCDLLPTVLNFHSK